MHVRRSDEHPAGHQKLRRSSRNGSIIVLIPLHSSSPIENCQRDIRRVNCYQELRRGEIEAGRHKCPSNLSRMGRSLGILGCLGPLSISSLRRRQRTGLFCVKAGHRQTLHLNRYPLRLQTTDVKTVESPVAAHQKVQKCSIDTRQIFGGDRSVRIRIAQ